MSQTEVYIIKEDHGIEYSRMAFDVWKEQKFEEMLAFASIFNACILLTFVCDEITSKPLDDRSYGVYMSLAMVFYALALMFKLLRY